MTMTMRRSTLFLLFTMTLLCLRAQSEVAWQLAKEEDGIKIYTRHTENSAFDEFKAESVFKAAKAEAIFNVLLDIELLAKSDDAIKSIKKLKTDSVAQEYIVYYQLRMPIFLKDRDVTYCYRPRSTSRGYFIESVVLPDYVPEDPEYVRMREGRLLQAIRQLDNGDVEYIFSGQISPGGNIPESMVNKTMVSSAYDRMVFIRKILSEQLSISQNKK